jgi:hypothetical protein
MLTSFHLISHILLASRLLTERIASLQNIENDANDGRVLIHYTANSVNKVVLSKSKFKTVQPRHQSAKGTMDLHMY